MPPRLKSLELHGYKTFASRTNFEFPGVITAIVGPNGSGKSNIADAMRWVLGEQSFSLLRGRKTEDMIFSGSEFRPRAGMASASVTFDNTDGWLPIDFSEVSITRRAYRDGQNEYLLNGQKVRLREISELLSQSGLAERTYTIIGQGLVDAALALKPEERRRLFEEAAGIGLYRSRREDALNRLENTRRNLERVQDILAELEPRLRSLEKQAKRAQEYERIRADLRLLLRDWYGYHWHRQQQEQVRAQEVLKVHETRLDQARQREEEMGKQIGKVRLTANELRARLNGWHTELAHWHQDREKLSRSLAILDERQRSLLEQQQNLQSDQVRLEEEINSLDQRIRKACDEQDRLQGEHQEAEAQADAARQALLERQVERARKEKDLRELRQRVSASESRQMQLKAHQNELTTRHRDLRTSLANLDQALTSAQAEVEKAQTRLDLATQERNQASQEREKSAAALQDFRRKIVELDAQRRKVIEERAQLETQKARSEAQLDVLSQAEQSFTGLGNGTRFVLQARRQGKLVGLYRALSQLLEVPADYEVAIASALGDYLDLILLDPEADPEQALRLLESGDKGRAALLPLAWIRGNGRLEAPKDPDVIGVAADLVKFSAENHSAVELLLGQVLIVRDRDAGRRLAANLPIMARAVTLRGEVFWANGSVVSGQENRSGNSVLSRLRQKRELQESLEEISRAILEKKNAIRSLDEELTRHREEETRLETGTRQAAARLEKTNETYQQSLLQIEQARRQLEWQTNQRKNTESQMKRTQDEMTQVGKDLAEIESRLVDFRERVRLANQELSNLPVEDLQNQVTHWTTRAAVSTRAVQDAENRVAELQQTQQKNQAQIQSLIKRRVDGNASLQSLEIEKSSAKEQEIVNSGLIEEIRLKIDPAEKELAETEKEYEHLQELDDSAQQALTVAERYHTQAQLDLTRQREAVENLRRRIEEDFGLVAFEFAAEITGQTPLPLEGMVEQLPDLGQIPPELEENITRIRGQLRRMGAINPDALTEYESVFERYQFMTTQVADLHKADRDLRQVIDELDELMRREFRKTFDAVAVEFRQMFTRLFGGGNARLILSDADHPTEAGIDIEARLPGRREQGLSLLSGGERSLTAVALVFSLLRVSPTPFCIMDEVDAMLDEANVGRFRDLLLDLSQTTQFIVITHNRNTVQAANIIYGVTMGKDSSSQIISLRLDEISEEMAK